MLKLLAFALAAYLALVAVMFFMQRSLLYLPARYSHIDTAALAQQGIRFWPDQDNYLGLLLGDGWSDEQNGTATVIVFHGNAGSAIDRMYYKDALAFTGAQLLLVEYPGYGARGGQPSEDTLVNEARLIISDLAAARPVDKLFVIGESLGAGVAAAAINDAQTARHIDGMMLITPWDSLAKVAARHYWYLPVNWLLKDRYDSIHNAARYEGPKLIVIAGDDDIIPATHGQTVFDALPDSKHRMVVESAGHNTWLRYVDQSWWEGAWQYLHTGKY